MTESEPTIVRQHTATEPKNRRLRRLFWEFVHNCLAHPLLFLTREVGWAVRLHDESARRAWYDVGIF